MANKPDKKEIEEAMIASEKINLGLLESHFHFLTGDIEEDNIADTIRWIIYENLKPEPNKVLTLMINSNGGDLTSAIALIDVMKNSNVPIRTIGVGAVISAAFFIFAAGTKGERFIGRNTSIMCHQYTANAEGKHHDLKAYAKEMELTNKKMLNLLKESTDLDLKAIKAKLLAPTDTWLTPSELIALGIADNFLNHS